MSQLFTLKSPEKYRKQFLLISAGFPKVSITCVNRHPVWYRYGLRQNEEREKKRCVEDRQKRRNEEEPWLEMVEGSNDLTYIFFDDVLSPNWRIQTILPIQFPLQYFFSGHMKTKNRCGMCMLLLPYICTFCITRPVVREGGRTTAKGRRAAPERRSLAAMNGFWLSSWDLQAEMSSWNLQCVEWLNDIERCWFRDSDIRWNHPSIEALKRQQKQLEQQRREEDRRAAKGKGSEL